MWTNINHQDELEDVRDVERSDLIGYYHPREIVADASLSVARRRALVAHWLSDWNAVRGVPGLRSTGTGVTASVDDLMAALRALDDIEATLPADLPGRQAPQTAGVTL
jgi:hypothetical protein